MKILSIVTINYNNEKATKKFLLSLSTVNIPGICVEIIVVDNGSETPFVTDDKNTIIIRSDKNTGFTGGNNIGIKKALERGANFVLIINNDTVVSQNMISNLLKVLESDKKIGAVVPKIYFSKGHEYHKEKYKDSELGRVIWFAGGYMDWKNAQSVHIGLDEVDQGQYDKSHKINFATGCCILLKREVLETIGLFDKKYFLYYEDADFSQRITKSGYEIYYVPSAILYHDNAGSSGSGSELHDYFLSRNQMIFGMRYAPLKTKAALIRQSLRLIRNGRQYQKKGIVDFYLSRFNIGTYFNKT